MTLEVLSDGPSVRMKVSVPLELEGLLVELAQLTGRSKASYALEALTWYLPRLLALRDDLRALKKQPGGMGAGAPHDGPAFALRELASAEHDLRTAQPAPRSAEQAASGLVQPQLAGEALTRQQRRQLERQQRKAQREAFGRPIGGKS